jgi:hypothetical protein
MRVGAVVVVLPLLGLASGAQAQEATFAPAVPSLQAPPAVPPGAVAATSPSAVANPPAARPPPLPPPVISPEPEAAPRRFSYQLSAGPLVGSLVGIPAYGGSLSALFGTASAEFALFGGVSGSVGRTEQGLLVTHLRGTFLAESRFDWLTVGAGGELGLLTVTRATTNPGLASSTLGLLGFVSADLVQWSNGSSLFLGLSPTVHSLLATNTEPPLFFTGTLQLGFRR